MKDRYAYFKDFFDNFYNVDELMPDRISEPAWQASFDVAAGSSPFATYACVDTWLTDFRRDLPKIDVPRAGRPRHGGQDPPLRGDRGAAPRAARRHQARRDRGRPSQHRLDPPRRGQQGTARVRRRARWPPDRRDALGHDEQERDVDGNDRTTAKRAHRVVVVGGGFGGLLATNRSRRVDVEVTLVDRTNHHLFQPLLYQVATGILSVGEVAAAAQGILRKHKNVHVELAEVAGFDLENRKVFAVRPLGTELAFALRQPDRRPGSTTSYFGHDELAEHSLPMKTIDDALNLRRRIFAAFELAESGAIGGRAPCSG